MARYSDEPVDVMDIARKTTQRDIERLPQGAIKVIAPAKVNLLLAVGPKRADGRHEVVNVMQTVMLHDTLYLWPLDEPGTVECACVSLEDTAPLDVAADDNLAVRAVRALAEAAFGSAAAAPGIGIRIEKHIPAQAGLGGGSSDAAAALVGAARLWRDALTQSSAPTGAAAAQSAVESARVSRGTCAQGAPEPAGEQAAVPVAARLADAALLEQVAAGLGADVAFFLKGGAALMDGAGEHFVRQLASRKDALVIIRPDEGLDTGKVYAAFDELLVGLDRPDTFLRQAEAALAGLTEASAIPLMNALQEPSSRLLASVRDILQWAAARPEALAVQMSGSGSAVFVICPNMASACKLTGDAKLRGWWARSTSFAPLKAAIVPAQ